MSSGVVTDSNTKFIKWQAVFTLLLLVVTVTYAYSTWEIAQSMKNQFELMQAEFEAENRPYVFVSGNVKEVVLTHPTNETTIITMGIRNSGEIPARVRLVQGNLILNGTPLSQSSKEQEMFIFPKDEIYADIKISHSTVSVEELFNAGEFSVHIKLEYWRIKDYDGSPYLYDSIWDFEQQELGSYNFGVGKAYYINAN